MQCLLDAYCFHATVSVKSWQLKRPNQGLTVSDFLVIQGSVWREKNVSVSSLAWPLNNQQFQLTFYLWAVGLCSTFGDLLPITERNALAAEWTPSRC